MPLVLATTYWIGLAPLLVGVVGLLFAGRIVRFLESVQPMTGIEPKSRPGKLWVEYAGLSGEGPGWERARFIFVCLVLGAFAASGALALIGAWNPYE